MIYIIWHDVKIRAILIVQISVWFILDMESGFAIDIGAL